MKVSIRKLLPLGVLALLGGLAVLLLQNPPGSPQAARPTGPALTVEVAPVRVQPYRVHVSSYGTVRPRTRSVLAAQVGGQVVEVMPQLRDGGFFAAGDVLMAIDPRDYQADLKIAEAGLLDARQSLAEERARSEQARIDWDRLGQDGQPTSLVLRTPQLDAARARVISAEAALDKARLDLERTRIVAPFAGRVLSKLVDRGQVVAANSQVAEIYATDHVEVRLPIRNADLAFLDLPESAEAELPATIYSDLGERETWPARIVRTEGAIDDAARQLHVVAQIEDPFRVGTDTRRPLKVGEYVTAVIEGRLIAEAVLVPNSVLYQGSYVYLAVEGLLQRRAVTVAWQNDEHALVAAGLAAGDQLVITPLGQITSGVAVNTYSGAASDAGAPESAGLAR